MQRIERRGRSTDDRSRTKRAGQARRAGPPPRLSEQVLHLAQVGCTDGEIAGALNVSEELVRRCFARQLRQGQALFRGRVRALLLASAAEGKVAAQVALCRLHLRDAEEEGASGAEGGASPERPVEEMTTSEMLDAYMEMRKRGRNR